MKAYKTDPEFNLSNLAREEQLLSFSAAVGIPLAQSLITSLIAGVSTGLVTAVNEPENALFYASLATFSTLGLSWIRGVRRWENWVYAAERRTGRDINGDGKIGNPRQNAPPETVRVEVIENDGRQMSFLDLPVSKPKLVALARHIMQGGKFSISALAGQGKSFSRPELEALRDELLKRGMLRWRNPAAPNQGVDFTRGGHAMLRTMASQAMPPGQMPILTPRAGSQFRRIRGGRVR